MIARLDGKESLQIAAMSFALSSPRGLFAAFALPAGPLKAAAGIWAPPNVSLDSHVAARAGLDAIKARLFAVKRGFNAAKMPVVAAKNTQFTARDGSNERLNRIFAAMEAILMAKGAHNAA